MSDLEKEVREISLNAQASADQRLAMLLDVIHSSERIALQMDEIDASMNQGENDHAHGTTEWLVVQIALLGLDTLSAKAYGYVEGQKQRN